MPSLRNLLDYGLPIGAQVAGGLINRRAAGRASQTLAGGANAAQARISQGSDAARRTMADVYGQNRETLRPFRETGAAALPGLREGVEEGGEFNTPFNAETFDLYKDPGFNFRLEQGRKAIEAGANAGGVRFSGATLKALSDYGQESASQEFRSAFDRHQLDTQGRFNRMSDVAGIGERAARDEVDAGSAYGANLARLSQTEAAQLADLEQQRADAEAAGDIAGANAITDTISGILGAVENVGTARSLADLAGGAAPIAGTSLAALGAGSVPAVAGTIGGTLPASMGVGGLSALGGTVPTVSATAPLAAGGAASGGGIGGALAGLATNPITWGVAGAIGAGLLWKKSQAHHEANSWVQGWQNPFDAHMSGIDRSAQSGQLSPEQAAQERRAAIADYMSAAAAFAAKGNDHKKVIDQAMREFRKYYSGAA